MFGYKSTREQLLERQRENAALQASLNQITADVVYLAMMTDVEMEDEDDE